MTRWNRTWLREKHVAAFSLRMKNSPVRGKVQTGSPAWHPEMEVLCDTTPGEEKPPVLLGSYLDDNTRMWGNKNSSIWKLLVPHTFCNYWQSIKRSARSQLSWKWRWLRIPVRGGQYYLTIGYRKTSLDKHSAGLVFLGLITVSESQVVIQTTTFNGMMLHHAE